MADRSGKPRARDPEGAPGDLGIVQAFVNTAGRSQDTDRLRSPRLLAGWLAAAGLLPPDTELEDADLERALAVRRSLRALVVARGRSSEASKADERLDRAAHTAHLRIRFAGGAPHLESAAQGLDAALGRLFGFVLMAHIDGSWKRLKICASPKCPAVFYDHSRNRSAKWCTPRCGNRWSARAARRRWKI